jgi:glucose-1-phosphate adenylyltransferase
MLDVLALVLGGGRGQRLYPLTKFRSKPAVPLAGKYRIVDIALSNCINSGINRIFVLTQFNSASLNKHVVHTYKFDMFSGGFVDILAAEQTPDSPDWFQGTADAVRQGIKHFAPYEVRQVLILSGDQLYQMDFRAILRFHQETNAEITIAGIPVTASETSGLGIMKVQNDGHVIAFHEKPRAEHLPELRCPWPGQRTSQNGRDYLANMGIYVFRKEFLVEMLTRSSALDFGKDLIPEAVGKSRVFAYVFDGYWTDIGTIRSFYDANLALTANPPRFNFNDVHRPVYTHPRNLPCSRLNNCMLHQSVIADGCLLDGCHITHSIVGVRSRIGIGTTIKNSIIMGADSYESVEELAANTKRGIPNIAIGNHCTIINAIIDKNVCIGDNVSIINAHNLRERDEETYNIRDGIIVVPKGAVIPSGTVV